jgi:pimeloyl-ACP methyl ester carboxylesterase
MPTLVLLPGMDGTGDLFAPFIDAAKGLYRTQVVRYPTDQALDFEELHALVQSALPTDEPYVVLGESFSGPIAISLAAEAPPLMRGLVLCCTFARNPRPALVHVGALLPFVPFRWTPSAALGAALLGSFGTVALRAAIARAVGRVDSPVLRARFRSVLKADVSAKLALVKVPCLYLQALQDRLVPANAVAHIKSVLPEISVVQINAPHCLLQAVPAEAAYVVSSFIREVQVDL